MFIELTASTQGFRVACRALSHSNPNSTFGPRLRQPCGSRVSSKTKSERRRRRWSATNVLAPAALDGSVEAELETLRRRP